VERPLSLVRNKTKCGIFIPYHMVNHKNTVRKVNSIAVKYTLPFLAVEILRNLSSDEPQGKICR
jgi:hypothetical protein